MNKQYVGEGKVVLIAGASKIYTDIAARFVGSERSLEEIIASPYDAKIVKNIVSSGHKAAVEFDYFIFGVEGYARVTEVQLVRKRVASYLIKSGRPDKSGKRSFDMVLPKDIEHFAVSVPVNPGNIILPDGSCLPDTMNCKLRLDANDLLDWTEIWYNFGVSIGKKEEDLRYMKQQATEFKAIIGMNAHGLMDWFQIRTCLNAQTEIRDMATKMLKLCKGAAPDLFDNAGASCKVLGYCPENKRQNPACRGKVFTKDEAMEILRNYRKVS